MLRAALVSIVIVAGCGRPAPEAPRAPGAFLPVRGDAILRVDNDGKVNELHVSPDGRVVLGDELLATIDGGGVMTDAEGHVMAKLAPSGALTIADEPRTLAVRRDGALLADGVVLIEFGRDGALTGSSVADGPRMVASGDVTGRRALTLVVAGWFLWPSDLPSGPSVEPTPRKFALGPPKVGAGLACDVPGVDGVHGLVRDGVSSEGLAGATVVLTTGTGSETVISDEHGCYFIEMAPGTYRLTIYHLDSTGEAQVTIAPGVLSTIHATLQAPR